MTIRKGTVEDYASRAISVEFMIRSKLKECGINIKVTELIIGLVHKFADYSLKAIEEEIKFLYQEKAKQKDRVQDT